MRSSLSMRAKTVKGKILFFLSKCFSRSAHRFTLIAKKLKIKAFGQDRCMYCGRLITVDNFTLDHKVPKASGGTDATDNMLICCASCNKYKGPWHIETFRKHGIGRNGKFYFESGHPVLIDYPRCYTPSYGTKMASYKALDKAFLTHKPYVKQ